MKYKYDVFISYSRRDYVDESYNVIPGNAIAEIQNVFDENGITYCSIKTEFTVDKSSLKLSQAQ